MHYNQFAKGWSEASLDSALSQSYTIDSSAILGKIPEDLSGTFLRNGPGLSQKFGKDFAHPIDSDGLVCGLSFSNGVAKFRSAFVETCERQAEEKANHLLFYGQMGTKPRGSWNQTIDFVRQVVFKKNLIKFRNPSNTNVFYWGDKILSCYETSTPYALNSQSLETIGKETLGGSLELKNLAAHFRVDPHKKSIVLMSHRPGLGREPALQFNEYDESWQLTHQETFHIPGLNYAHDFVMTDRYYLVHMSPFVKIDKLQALMILGGLTSPGDSMRYYKDLPSRFVLIDRHSSSKSGTYRCYDTLPCHIYHYGSCYTVGDTLHFNAVCLGPKFNMTFDKKLWLSNASEAPGHLYEFELDLCSNVSTHKLADKASVEFPTIHPYRHGLQTRYTYLMASDKEGQNLPYVDLVKYDAEGTRRQVYHSPYCLGEPIFIPIAKPFDLSSPEDDGYIVVQAYDYERDRSKILVLDAKDLERGPLADINLMKKIPFGFHGTYCPKTLWH